MLPRAEFEQLVAAAALDDLPPFFSREDDDRLIDLVRCIILSFNRTATHAGGAG